MGSSDFYIDYNIEVSDVSDAFKRETELRLRELAAEHSDIIGAAVALERVRTHKLTICFACASSSTSVRRTLWSQNRMKIRW